jgi:hypothetical protein
VTTDLLVILIFGACLAGWVLLALVGNERQRLMGEADAARARAQAEAAAPPHPARPAAGRPASKPRPASPAAPSPAPNAR